MIGLDSLEDIISFIQTHNPELLHPLYSNLNQLSSELESLCYLLLDEQKKQWFRADDSSLEVLHDHALVLKDFYLELLEQCPNHSIEEVNKQKVLDVKSEMDEVISGVVPNYIELSFDEDWTGYKVVGYYFCDEWVSVNAFKEIWIQLCSRLYKEYGSKLFKSYNAIYRKRTTPFFSTSSYELATPKKIPNTKFFASSKGQSNVQKRIILNLLDLTDYTLTDLKVYAKK